MTTTASMNKSDPLRRIYLYIYSMLLFFSPLVYVNNTNELYEFPKMFFVYVLGAIVAAIFVIERLFSGREIKRPNYIVLLILLTAGISTLFSSHSYTSLWGYYTRFNSGLVSLITYVGLYFVAINVFEPKDYRLLFRFVAFSTLMVSVYGIAQNFIGVVRVYSTIGQPNWLAQYLVMVLPILVYEYLGGKKRMNLWLFTYLMSYLCLWFTYSLSGLIGFAVSSLVLVVLFYKDLDKEKINRLAMLGVITVAVSLLFPGIFKDKLIDINQDVSKLRFSFVPHVYALGDGNKVSDPGYIRFGLWRGSLDVIRSSFKVFSIGSGLGTFPYVFQDYRPLSLNYSSEWDFVFNKPHNYYLELWIETGIVGLLAYLIFLFGLFKRVPKPFIPVLMAFVVTNFFGWPTVVTNVLFWVLVAPLGYERDKK
ncbi:O-antigen ligase family protein [Patescibacteria group bacterium]|nr:O-antigen ligase family protein [Patescibacteria group bacterium]